MVKDIKLNEGITLVISSADTYNNTNKDITKKLTGKKVPGIYVALNKPYFSLKKQFQENDINTDLIIFIDGSTASIKEKETGVIFINSPNNLTDLSIAITEAANKIPSEKKFVIIDSISTLIVYNELGTVSRFVHFLMNKIRSLNLTGVIISLEGELETQLESKLKSFADDVIISGGD